MQRLQFILFQIDEASRNIKDGRLEHLRVALLLLDNTVELQLRRRAHIELREEEFLDQLRKFATNSPNPRPPKQLEEQLKVESLSKKQIGDIHYSFPKLVEFLGERRNVLDARLADIIKYVHGQYRNEAYHKATVRKETIATAAAILLEINCQLLPSLTSEIIISSDEDYSWLEERFGLHARNILADDTMVDIAKEYQKKHGLEPKKIAGLLNQHLDDRIAEIFETLDFISSTYPDPPDREAVLKACQYWEKVVAGKIDPSQVALDAFTPADTLESIEAIRQRSVEILHAGDSLDTFHRFMQLEEELEAIEQPVIASALQADMYIQNQIDQMRGK